MPVQMTHVIRGAYNLSKALLEECLCLLPTLALVPYMECQHVVLFTFVFANTHYADLIPTPLTASATGASAILTTLGEWGPFWQKRRQC